MLNEEQQIELAAILANPTYIKASEEALLLIEGDTSRFLAPEANIQLAIEKGSRMFGRVMKRLTVPARPQQQPALKNTLTR